MGRYSALAQAMAGRLGPNSSYDSAGYTEGGYQPSNIAGRNAVTPGRGQPFGIDLGQRTYGMGPLQAAGMVAGAATSAPLGTLGMYADRALAPEKNFGVAAAVSPQQHLAAINSVRSRRGMAPLASLPGAAMAGAVTPTVAHAARMTPTDPVAAMQYGQAGPVRVASAVPTLGGIGSQGLSWGGGDAGRGGGGGYGGRGAGPMGGRGNAGRSGRGRESR